MSNMLHSHIFVDAVSAFYSVLRSLALPGPNSDFEIAAVAAAMGLEEGALHELYDFIGECAFNEADARKALTALITEPHGDTWFGVEGRRECVRT